MGALVNRQAQGFAGLEVGHFFFRDGDALTAARVASHARWAIVHGETAKAAYFNAMTACQGIVHGLQNGLYRKFGIALGDLGKSCCKFFNEVGAGHKTNTFAGQTFGAVPN